MKLIIMSGTVEASVAIIGGVIMPLMARAWTGEKMVFDFALRSDGTPMHLVGVDSDKHVVYESMPAWTWMHWTGFYDREEKQIFVNDVVEIGAGGGKSARVVVRFESGRFVVRLPFRPDGDKVVGIARYCCPAYVHLIKVVGNAFEDPETSLSPKRHGESDSSLS